MFQFQIKLSTVWKGKLNKKMWTMLSRWMLTTRTDIILMRHFKKLKYCNLFIYTYKTLPFAHGFIMKSHRSGYKIFHFSKKKRVQYKINHQGKWIFCACLSLQMSSVFQAHFYIHSILYRILFIFTFSCWYFAVDIYTRTKKKKTEDEMWLYVIMMMMAIVMVHDKK